MKLCLFRWFIVSMILIYDGAYLLTVLIEMRKFYGTGSVIQSGYGGPMYQSPTFPSPPAYGSAQSAYPGQSPYPANPAQSPYPVQNSPFPPQQSPYPPQQQQPQYDPRASIVRRENVVSKASLARCVLAELPDQLVQWMKKFNMSRRN